MLAACAAAVRAAGEACRVPLGLRAPSLRCPARGLGTSRLPARGSRRTPRRLWEDSEVERLRRENERLRSRLRQQDEEALRRENERLRSRLRQEQQEEARGSGGGSSEGLIQKIANGVKSLFGQGDSDRRDSNRKDVAESALTPSLGTLPGALGLVGGLLMPLMKMAGGLFKEAQGGVESVLDASRAAILRSGRLGSRVECGQIYSQSYASMNINGRQTTQVQLQFQVKGERGTGMASCDASIGPDGAVNFRDLRLDGSPVDTTSGSTRIIDV